MVSQNCGIQGQGQTMILTRTRVVLSTLAAACLAAACGGQDVVPSAAEPFALKMADARTAGTDVRKKALASTGAEVDAEALFDWAEFKFPDLFPASGRLKFSFNYLGVVYSLRYYVTDNYLGLTDSSAIWGLGPFTSLQLAKLGLLSDFASQVVADRCKVYPDGSGCTSAETTTSVRSATCGSEFAGMEFFCRVVGNNLPTTTTVSATHCQTGMMMSLPGGSTNRREFSCAASGGGKVTVSVPGLAPGTPIPVVMDRFVRWGAPRLFVPSSAPAPTSCAIPDGLSAQDFTQVGSYKVYAGECIASLTLNASAWNAVVSSGGNVDQLSFARQFSQWFRDEYDFLLILLDHTDVPPGFGYFGQYQTLATRRPLRSRRQLGTLLLPFVKSALGYPNPIQGGPMLHELLHEWANYDALPTAEAGHWGFASVGGQLGGFEADAGLHDLGGGQWSANGPARTCLPGATSSDRATYCAPRASFGTFANGGNSIAYSALELYLMGLEPASAVPAIKVADSAAWVPGYEGQRFTASSWSIYTVNDIAARLGVSAPTYGRDQRDYRVATLVLTPNATLDTSTLEVLNNTLTEFSRAGLPGYGSVGDIYLSLHNFHTATDGKATMRAGNLLGMRR